MVLATVLPAVEEPVCDRFPRLPLRRLVIRVESGGRVVGRGGSPRGCARDHRERERAEIVFVRRRRRYAMGVVRERFPGGRVGEHTR